LKYGFESVTFLKLVKSIVDVDKILMGLIVVKYRIIGNIIKNGLLIMNGEIAEISRSINIRLILAKSGKFANLR